MDASVDYVDSATGRNREVDTVTQTAEAQECTACWVTVAQGCQDDYFGGAYCRQDCEKLMSEIKRRKSISK